ESAPVGVGLLGDDLALLDHALQDAGDVEAFAAALEAQRQVLEVDEDGQGAFAFSHGYLVCGVPGGPRFLSVAGTRKAGRGERQPEGGRPAGKSPQAEKPAAPAGEGGGCRGCSGGRGRGQNSSFFPLFPLPLPKPNCGWSWPLNSSP